MSNMVEKAKLLAKLAELRNSKGPDDIISWIENNDDWVYPMIIQLVDGVSNKYGILSCDKMYDEDTVTFVMTTENSDCIYHGFKNMIADNAGMVKKLKAKFSVDKVDDKVVSVKIYIIPGRTESFMKLISLIENGISEYNSRGD